MKVSIGEIKDCTNLAVFYRKADNVRYTYGKNYGMFLMTTIDNAWWWGDVDSYRLASPHPRGGDVECFMERGIPVFMCNMCIMSDSKMLRTIDYSEQMWIKNVMYRPELLEYCRNVTAKIAVAAVQVDPSIIWRWVNQSDEIMMECLEANPRCYKWIKSPTRDMTEFAMLMYPDIIQEVSPNKIMLELVGVRYDSSIDQVVNSRESHQVKLKDQHNSKSDVQVLVENIHTAMELSNKDLLETVRMTVDMRYYDGDRWVSVFMDDGRFMLWQHRKYRMFVFFDDDHIIPMDSCSSIKAKWFQESGMPRACYDCYFRVVQIKTDRKHRVGCYCEIDTDTVDWYFDRLGVVDCCFEFDVLLKGSGRHSVFQYKVKFDVINSKSMLIKRRLRRWYEEVSPTTRWLLGGAARVSKGVVVGLKKVVFL